MEGKIDEFMVDDIIEQLLSIRNKVPGPSCVVDLDVDLIYKLIEKT